MLLDASLCTFNRYIVYINKINYQLNNALFFDLKQHLFIYYYITLY